MTEQLEENDGADERLIDVVDIASAVEAHDRDKALLAIRAKCRQQQQPLHDGTFAFPYCEQCGNEIGLGRLRVAAMNLLCVHCASARERRQ